MADALLGLGGNLGDVAATLNRAIAMLCDGSEVKLRARSANYRTAPWGIADQPAFINLCIAVATDLPPHSLLARIQTVERALGRDRTSQPRWGPRTVDIDILAYDDLTMDEPELQIPHPRLFERAFVLVPLAEIAPDRLIAGRRIGDAAAEIGISGVEKLPD